MSLKVLLFSGHVSVISKAIEWETRSKYCHAAILLRDNSLIESIEGVGVRQLSPWTGPQEGESVDHFTVTIPFDEDKIESFLRAQVGKPYATKNILGFLAKESKDLDPGKFFCSELVFAAIQAGGVDLLSRVQPYEVSPGILALSPLLVPAT
jgi:uncharacterized protein YycO